MRAGFASVHTDQDMSRAMLTLQIRAKRASCGEESGVVKRRRARDAANPVGPKELFGHEKKPVSPERFLARPQPTSAWMAWKKA
jgi:hypothetical protein